MTTCIADGRRRAAAAADRCRSPAPRWRCSPAPPVTTTRSTSTSTSPESAGLDDVFAHGMLSMAYLGRLLTDWVPQDAIRSYKVRFAAITPVHGAADLHRARSPRSRVGRRARATVDLSVALADGTITLTGDAVIASSEPPTHTSKGHPRHAQTGRQDRDRHRLRPRYRPRDRPQARRRGRRASSSTTSTRRRPTRSSPRSPRPAATRCRVAGQRDRRRLRRTFRGDRGRRSSAALDIIVNNAGYTWDSVIQKMTDDQWDAILDVHLKAPFRILRAAQPVIAAAVKEARGAGTPVPCRKVVNISSIAGLGGNAGQANYAAAKAGVIGLTKALAKEWGRYNVNVNTVAFGLIRTRLTEAAADGDGTIDIEGREIARRRQPDPALGDGADDSPRSQRHSRRGRRRRIPDVRARVRLRQRPDPGLRRRIHDLRL